MWNSHQWQSLVLGLLASPESGTAQYTDAGTRFDGRQCGLRSASRRTNSVRERGR